MTTQREKRIAQTVELLASLGMPLAQLNDRSALCLLALLNLTHNKKWSDASNPLVGITPIMDWARAHYDKDYAPNTRETFRRQSMHQFVAAGLALYNPDEPLRSVNSPKAVYQIEPAALNLLRSVGTESWQRNLLDYLKTSGTLAATYAGEREQNLIPVALPTGTTFALSAGELSGSATQI